MGHNSPKFHLDRQKVSHFCDTSMRWFPFLWWRPRDLTKHTLFNYWGCKESLTKVIHDNGNCIEWWACLLPFLSSTSKDGNFFRGGHEEQLEKQGQSEPAVISNALFNKSFCLLYRLLNPPSQREKIEPKPLRLILLPSSANPWILQRERLGLEPSGKLTLWTGGLPCGTRHLSSSLAERGVTLKRPSMF